MDSDEDSDEEEEADEEMMEKEEEPEKQQDDSVASSASSSGASSSSSSAESSPEPTLSEVQPSLHGDDARINLAQYESAQGLEAVGLDGLKQELLRLGLLCGGSLQQRAERLFATKGKERAQWDTSLYQAKKGKKKKRTRKPVKDN